MGIIKTILGTLASSLPSMLVSVVLTVVTGIAQFFTQKFLAAKAAHLEAQAVTAKQHVENLKEVQATEVAIEAAGEKAAARLNAAQTAKEQLEAMRATFPNKQTPKG